MKPEGSAEHHQMLSSRGCGLGTRLVLVICYIAHYSTRDDIPILRHIPSLSFSVVLSIRHITECD